MKLSTAIFALLLLATNTATVLAAADGNVLDVAIIGAGTAGSYAGWRILSSPGNEDLNVELFERQGHVGGRFYSPRIGCDGDTSDEANLPRTELGGMRIRNSDKLMHGVVKQLGIKIGPFYMNKATPDPGPFDDDGSTLAAFEAQCEEQADEKGGLKGGLDCAGDEPTSPIYLNGLLTDRATMETLKTEDMFYPGPNEQTVTGESAGAIPFIVDPWATTTSVDTAAGAATSTPSDGENTGARRKLKIPPVIGHAYMEGNTDSLRRLVEEGADPCNINNFEIFAVSGNSKTKLTDDVKGFKQSIWGKNSLNLQSKEQMDFNDAISGYGGKLGSTSALNLAQADLTFTPSKPQNGVNVPEQPTVSYTRPLTGMQTIPLELEKAFRSEGGKTSLNTQLLKVQKNGDMDYELTLRKTWSSPCNQITSFSGPDGSGAGEVFTVKAKKVLISLTKSALERVTFYDATGKSELADTVKRLTDALDSAPALKYFAAYDDRWWETKAQEHPDFPSQEPFNVGRLTSSAYINNMFPWFPGTQDLKGVCPSNPDMGVIQNYITGFADLTYAGTLNQDFQNECNETEVDQCGICFNESTDFVGPATNHASKFLSEMMRYQLAVVFGFDPQEYEKHIPEPTEVRYQLWSNSNPVTQTDSCHYFKSGYEWWDLYEAARDLTDDGSLSLIGETMSYNWFWGEGALETTEYVLEEVYGLARPSWLTKEEYCWAMPYWPSPRANPTGKSIMGDDTGSVTTNTSVTSPDSITSSSAVTTSSSFVAVSVAAAVFSLTVMLF